MIAVLVTAFILLLLLLSLLFLFVACLTQQVEHRQVLAEGYSKALNFFSTSGQESTGLVTLRTLGLSGLKNIFFSQGFPLAKIRVKHFWDFLACWNFQWLSPELLLWMLVGIQLVPARFSRTPFPTSWTTWKWRQDMAGHDLLHQLSLDCWWGSESPQQRFKDREADTGWVKYGEAMWSCQSTAVVDGGWGWGGSVRL